MRVSKNYISIILLNFKLCTCVPLPAPGGPTKIALIPDLSSAIL